MRTLRGPALVFSALVVVIAAGVLTMHWIRADEPLALDQGLFACFARWVPRGWLPYRDLFDSKPPLYLYAWTLATAMPGDIATAMWRLETLWLGGSMIATFVLVRRMTGDRYAALAAAALLFVGLWCPAWGGYWSRAQAEELAVLPIMLAAMVALREPTPRRLIALGALTGVVGLFKIPAMAVAAAWPVMWLGDGWRRVPGRAGFAVIGLALPWLGAAAFFAAHGAFHDFVQGVFVHQRYYAAVIAPPWGDTIVDFVRTVFAAVPELLLLAAVGLVSLPRRERLYVGAWIASTMLAVLLQRQLAGYHYVLIVPGLAVASGCGLVAVLRWHRAAAATVLIAFVALAGRTAVAWMHAYGADASFERGIFSPAVEAEAAAYLRAHTQPNERILVWGLAPGIYALADRAPATKYPFHKILMTDAPLSRRIPGLAERRADFMARVLANPPSYVLVGRRDENGFEPDDSFTSLAAFPELNDLLHTRYHLETEIGRFVVLRSGTP